MNNKSRDLQLHEAIRAKKPVALSRLFDIYGHDVIKALKSWYPKHARIDEQLIIGAVNEAFWGYYRNPNTYAPKKSSIKRFLEVAAERDLLNILRKEGKLLDNKEALPENVELEQIFWNRVTKEGNSPEDNLIFLEGLEAINKELEQHFDNPRDIELAKLILAKEREMEKYSHVLELVNLPVNDQRNEVKRHKDRIKKVLERNQVENALKKLIR